jgi:magnesium-transporting ATPase (P-type)
MSHKNNACVMYSTEQVLLYSTQYSTTLNNKMNIHIVAGQFLNTGSGTVMRVQKLVVIFCQLSVNIIVCTVQQQTQSESLTRLKKIPKRRARPTTAKHIAIAITRGNYIYCFPSLSVTLHSVSGVG